MSLNRVLIQDVIAWIVDNPESINMHACPRIYDGRALGADLATLITHLAGSDVDRTRNHVEQGSNVMYDAMLELGVEHADAYTILHSREWPREYQKIILECTDIKTLAVIDFARNAAVCVTYLKWVLKNYPNIHQ